MDFFRSSLSLPTKQKQAPKTKQKPLDKNKQIISQVKLEVIGVSYYVKNMSMGVIKVVNPEYEIKRMDELLTQLMLKLDSLEIHGRSKLRAKRKKIIMSIQNILKILDGIKK